MKAKKVIMIVMLMGLVLANSLQFNVATAAGSSAKFAYSIGVNHATTDTSSGDFTGNVFYAATVYGMMSGISNSYYQYAPSVSYLRTETNPNGVRKIASDVVFINGHGNNQAIIFGEALGSGIYYGYDTNISVYQLAGLQSIGSMHTVDLISFVGCDTAAGTDNLTERAVSLGAATAVGFTDAIVSRFLYGPLWLERYNDHLSQGYSVYDAVNYATYCYPTSNLGTYVYIAGNGANTIASSISDELSNLQCKSAPSNAYAEATREIDINLGQLNNCVDIQATECSFRGFEEMITCLKRVDSGFDINKYRITINMYSPNDSSGYIIFKYIIDGEIVTNSAYIIKVEKGVATAIISSMAISDTISNREIKEEQVSAAVDGFKQKVIRDGSIDSTREEGEVPINAQLRDVRRYYHYDYMTEELSYVEEYYYVTMDGANICFDHVKTWIIET